MGIDFALKHFEIIILVGLKSIEVFFLFGVKATHTHTFLTKIGFLIPTDQVQEANRKWEVLNVQICGFYFEKKGIVSCKKYIVTMGIPSNDKIWQWNISQFQMFEKPHSCFNQRRSRCHSQ